MTRLSIDGIVCPPCLMTILGILLSGGGAAEACLLFMFVAPGRAAACANLSLATVDACLPSATGLADATAAPPVFAPGTAPACTAASVSRITAASFCRSSISLPRLP